ncbi:3'-5' exonuclease, partial [Pseudomonas aeruginosa]
KGLEFPLVFLVGMEEGLFPPKMSLEESGRLEEERRLAYVGVTRAMQRLVLTYAETRRLYGSETYNKVSRFIREIPPALIQEVRLSNTVSRPYGGTSRSAGAAEEVAAGTARGAAVGAADCIGQAHFLDQRRRELSDEARNLGVCLATVDPAGLRVGQDQSLHGA